MTETVSAIEEIKLKCKRGCGATITVPVEPSLTDELKERFRRLIPKKGAVCWKCLDDYDKEEEKRRLYEIGRWGLADVRNDIRRAMGFVGVPDRLLEASFAAMPDIPQGLAKAAKGWAKNPTGFLLLSGSIGSGKTWTAIAILREMLLTGRFMLKDVLYLSEGAYLDELKADYDAGGGDVPYHLLSYRQGRKVKLLILDDLGSANLTDWGRGEIAKLIDVRYTHELPTVLTSNLSLGDVGRNIDARAASRIGESKGVHTFPPKDLRLTGRYANTMPSRLEEPTEAIPF